MTLLKAEVIFGLAMAVGFFTGFVADFRFVVGLWLGFEPIFFCVGGAAAAAFEDLLLGSSVLAVLFFELNPFRGPGTLTSMLIGRGLDDFGRGLGAGVIMV